MNVSAAEFAGLADTLAECGIAAHGTVREIVALHQRSLCYRVETSGGEQLFVKKARRTATGEWSADVAAEGMRLQELATRLPGETFFPRAILLDRRRRLLITTCYPGHAHLDFGSPGAHSAAPHADPDAAGGEPGDPDGEPGEVGGEPGEADTHPDGRRHLRALGRSLAATHSIHRPDPSRDDPGSVNVPETTCAATLIDSLLRPTPTAVASFPAGYAEVLVAIRSGGLADPLSALAARFRPTTFIHGDLKSNNILCARPHSVRLVDWETAGWGDARWDFGAIIGDAIFTWLTGISFTGPGGLTAWLASARRPIGHTQADIAAVRAGYLRGGAADPTEDAGDRAVCLGFAAAFLLQRTMASALQAPLLPPLALAALHLARQLLTRPEDLSEVLL